MVNVYMLDMKLFIMLREPDDIKSLLYEYFLLITSHHLTFNSSLIRALQIQVIRRFSFIDTGD